MLGLAAAAILAVGAAHLPPVQEAAWRRAAAWVARETGWRLAARRVRLRLLPARLVAEGLAAGADPRRPVVRTRRVEARWSWWNLLARRRLRSLEVEGLEVDGEAPLPRPAGAAPAPALPLAIGRFTVTARGSWPAGPVEVRAEGVRLAGRGDGTLRLELSGRVHLAAHGVELVAGRLEADAVLAGARPVALAARLAADRAGVLAARLEPGDPPAVALSGRLDLGVLWARAVAALGAPVGLAVRGRPRLAARVTVAPGALAARGELAGGGLEVAGLPLDRAAGGWDGASGAWRAEVAGPWGEARAHRDADGAVELAARLDGLEPPAPLSAAPGGLVPRVPVRLSGSVTARLPAGWRPERGAAGVTASWDLEAATGAVRAAVRGRAADGAVELERASLAAPGGAVRASGRAWPRLRLDLAAEIPDAAAFARALRGALPLPGPPAGVSGSLRVTARVEGSPARPRVRLEAEGRALALAGRRLEAVRLAAEGDARRASVSLSAEAAGAEVEAGGEVSLARREVAGTATLRTPSVGGTLAALGLPEAAAGRARATVRGRWAPGGWRAELDAAWTGAAAGGVALGEVRVRAAAGPWGLDVGRLVAEGPSGRLEASGRVEGWGPAAPLAARVAVRGLRTPAPAAGRAEATLRLAGTLGRPEAAGEARWRPERAGPLLGLRARLALAGGRLTAAPVRLLTAAGEVVASAEVPLGLLPRPRWLWPGAPAGPARLTADGCALELAPVLALSGREAPLDASADLALDLEVDGPRLADLRGTLRLEGLRLATPMVTLAARGPVEAGLDGGRAWLGPLRLAGDGTRLELSASCELGRRWVRARARGTVGASVLRALLPAAHVEGGLRLEARLEGPLGELAGGARIEHRGSVRIADPPVEVRGAWVEVSLGRWGLSIEDGGATVNGGTVTLGGGWDPASGQGVVAELEGVTLLLGPGVLTRWSGPLAVEPRPEGAAVVADLELERGIWDGPFDLAAATAPAPPPPAAGDPLERVTLEIEASGGPGIWVDNNLGRFRVTWRHLEVGGTLARPLPAGRLRVLPGGELAVGGRSLKIVRGTVELPGRPGAAPEIEIVARDETVGGGVRQLGLAEILQAGASTALGRLLGAEPATAPPVEVAAETETVRATRLTLGQRFGRHVTLYVSTDLGSSGDRTTLLQLGGFRQLPGLVAQAFDSTLEPSGWALLERWRWGGSRDEEAAGPRLETVRLAGPWPVSRRLLRWAAGIRAGQRWDPFLAFAAEVRLERELAARGWPEARVRAEVEGPPERPRLVLRCEPGPRLSVRWEGDRVPRAVRRRVLALYRGGALEAASLEAMAAALERELAARGYPFARAEVRRERGGLRIAVRRGERLELERLDLEGVPPETAAAVAGWMHSPADLAALLRADAGTLARLAALLAAEGFPEARIGTPERVDTGGRRAAIRVRVEPGPRMTVGEVRLEGSDPLGRLASPAFPLREGAPLRRRLLEAARRSLLGAYRRAGYPAVRVRVRVGPARGGRAPVTVRLDPGARRTVGVVRLAGLRYLRPETLLPGVAVRPGRPLVDADLDRTVARIAQFPPVESVTVEVPEGEGPAEVVLHVRERPRWSAGAGLRWQGERGQQLLLEAADEDLLGRGVALRLRARLGSKDRSVFGWLAVPAPPGGSRSWALVGSLRRTDRGDVRDRTTALVAETRWRAGDGRELRLYLESSWARTTAIASGERVESSHRAAVGAQALWDRRSSPLDPRNGFLAALDLSVAPAALGADPPTVRAVAHLAWAATPRERLTLAQSVRLGAARALAGSLARADRLFAGGETSVRGFDQDALGPVTCDTLGCRPAGGGALLVLQQEARWRLGGALELAGFLDAGQVWPGWSDADARLGVGAGVGLRVATPVGPLRLDLAWPVAHKGSSSGLHLYLGVGQLF